MHVSSDAPAATASRPSPPSGPEQLNDLLWEVMAYVELIGERALADTPLTLASSGLLTTVLGEPGITVAEVSRRIPKTQQAISQVAARLEKLGLIERRVGAGRGIGLFVTRAGGEMAEVGREREAALDAHLAELLGEERVEHLLAVLGESRALLRETKVAAPPRPAST